MNKYYAIRWKDGSTEIKCGVWSEVSKLITGKPGVTYKGFFEEKEAVAWTKQGTVTFREKNTPLLKDTLYIFVDGSFSSKRKVSGWGWVAVWNDKIVAEAFGVLTENLESRNICGETYAAMQAVRWYTATETKNKAILVHDYQGISCWALGQWHAASKVAKDYVAVIKPHLHKFLFEKCSGHSETKWNDYADNLTRKGYKD